jgi:HD superfamily phosphohydrolase YqeK
MKQKVAVKKMYATVFEDDGADYRMISQAMTDVGWKMNHTSARNHVLRVMNKFARAYAEKFGIEPTEAKLSEIARDARFQSAISDMLQTVFYADN